MSACESVCLCAGVCGGQKKVLALLELELQADRCEPPDDVGVGNQILEEQQVVFTSEPRCSL